MHDEANVGLIDRVARIIVGVAILVLAHTLAIGVFVQAVLIVVGSVLAVTGLVGYCLLYKIFDFRTTRLRH